MEPKGNVLIKKEFVHTTLWPNEQFTLDGWIDLEKEYKEGLAGKMCVVMDIAVDGSDYLVLGYNSKGGAFLWTVEKGDTVGFIPVIKKNGILVPCGMSPIEEFLFFAKATASKMNDYK